VVDGIGTIEAYRANDDDNSATGFTAWTKG
jgi:hypothetical protein